MTASEIRKALPFLYRFNNLCPTAKNLEEAILFHMEVKNAAQLNLEASGQHGRRQASDNPRQKTDERQNRLSGGLFLPGVPAEVQMKCAGCQLRTVCSSCGKQMYPADEESVCKLKDYWTCKEKDYRDWKQTGVTTVICFECEEKKWRQRRII